jgi:hypothetical protein
MVNWIQTAILLATAVIGAAAVWVQHRQREAATLERRLEAVAGHIAEILESLLDTSAVTGEEPRFSVAKSRLQTALALLPRTHFPLMTVRQLATATHAEAGFPSQEARNEAYSPMITKALEEVSETLAELEGTRLLPFVGHSR